MDERTDRTPNIEALKHTNILLTALELTELFPCVWVCEGGDGALVVKPSGTVCLCGSQEIALRLAALEWNFYKRPLAVFDDPNWPALSTPWLMPTLENPMWLRLRRWLSRLARRSLRR